MTFRIFTAIVLCATLTQTVHAQVAEVRFGITEFDERSLNIPIAVKYANENSLAVNAEIIFDEPNFLKWAYTPQPYINSTLNLEGETSFGGAGLLWRQSFGNTFYADISIGGVIHNGTKDVRFDYDLLDQGLTFDQAYDEYIGRLDTQIEFGSRLLFREQITLGYRLNQNWAGEVFYEHLSNAWLAEDNRNDGVDNIGVKVARRF